MRINMILDYIMINKVVFENEIDIWWDKFFKTYEKLSFEVFLNGKKTATTNFTHYEFKNLQPNNEYKISVVALVRDTDKVYKELGEIIVKTPEKKNVLNIKESPYNALGDGETDDTKAIQLALDTCTENDVVYIPKGKFLIGSLNVHSNTEIYIEKNGALIGSKNRESYLPKRKSRFEGYELERYSAMINVGKIDNSCLINCEKVVIRGEGEIIGGGLDLAKSVIEYENIQLKDYIASLGEKIKTFDRVEVISGRQRPFLIDVNNCDNFILHGLKVGYGACWNVHFCYCKNVVISSCNICSEIKYDDKSVGIWNGDGIDPDSSYNTVIYDVEFDTHDDAIAIKSGKNPEGNVINVPCTELRIFHVHGQQGIAIGSELSGGIENIYFWDVLIERSYRGIRIKTTPERGGYVKNVVFSNITTPVFSIDCTYECNRDGESSGCFTDIKDLYIEDLVITGEAMEPFVGLTLYGFDNDQNSIKNVEINNLTLNGKCSSLSQELKIDNVRGLNISNFKVVPIDN